MKNTHSVALMLGTTCLATIAFTQTSRPGERPVQSPQTAAAGQNTAGSLMQVQQRFQQVVATEVRTGAMKQGVTVDDSTVMISLLGQDRIIAGAAATKSGSGSKTDAQRKPGDTGANSGTEGQKDRSSGSQGNASAADRDGYQQNADQQVVGVILFSRSIAPQSMNDVPGDTTDKGRRSGDQSDQANAAGRQAPARDADGQGTTIAGTQGSSELVTFEVRRSQQNRRSVELMDAQGRVALRVPLLGSRDDSRTREASAPREDREDATVGGGDPLGDPRVKDPQGQGRDLPRTAAGRSQDMDQSASNDWSIVYASVVHHLCREHHGDK